MSLGPEGKKLAQNMASSVTSTPKSDEKITAEVESLLMLFESSSSTQTGPKLVSYFAYYLPLIKKQQLLHRLMHTFLNSKNVFNKQSMSEVDTLFTIVDYVRLSFNNKIKVSNPSIRLPVFYNIMLQSLLSLEPTWINKIKQNLFLAGILSSYDTLTQYKAPEDNYFFHKFEKSATETLVNNFNFVSRAVVKQNLQMTIGKALNLLSLACIFDHLSSSLQSKIDYSSMCLFATRLTLSTCENKDTNPSTSVIRLLNKLAFLLQMALRETAKKETPETNRLVQEVLYLFLNFSASCHKNAVANSAQIDWDFLKQELFFTILVIQGYLDASYYSGCFNQGLTFHNARNITMRSEYHKNSIVIFKVLFWQHFIVQIIGTGGFGAYKNFYLALTQILLETKKLLNLSADSMENLSGYFLSNIELDSIATNEFERCKFLFLLGFWETPLVLGCSPRYYDTVIVPVTTEFIEKPYKSIDFNNVEKTRSVLESCHSVRLTSFELERLAENNCRHMLSYVSLLLHQYPEVLSSNQLILAIEKIASLVHVDGIIGRHDGYLQEKFLEKILHKVKTTKSGVVYKKEGQSKKSTFVVAFIKAVPYIEQNVFLLWLDALDEEISKCNPEEKAYCEKELWTMITNSLGLIRADLAFKWWYSRSKSKL